jgi:hypothetical protein
MQVNLFNRRDFGLSVEVVMRQSGNRNAWKNRLRGGWRGQRGEGRLKAILWTAVLLVLIYIGFKLVPAYVSQYQLQDHILEEARFVTVNRKTDDQIRDDIYREIQDLNIPARKEDIKLENTPHLVRISVAYTVPVDLFFYHTELHFVAAAENTSLTA